jgi:hypothetical protein
MTPVENLHSDDPSQIFPSVKASTNSKVLRPVHTAVRGVLLMGEN